MDITIKVTLIIRVKILGVDKEFDGMLLIVYASGREKDQKSE